MWFNHLSQTGKIPVDRIHKAMCMRHLYITDALGNYYGEYDTTRHLTVHQMYDFLREVEVFAAELNIILPTPEDLIMEAYLK